jgi:hypothetical protein
MRDSGPQLWNACEICIEVNDTKKTANENLETQP